jgi:hypothetical protein
MDCTAAGSLSATAIVDTGNPNGSMKPQAAVVTGMRTLTVLGHMECC